MASTTTVPITAFLGTFTSAAVAIPDTATDFEITVTPSAAILSNPALRVSIAIDFSPDNGVTWASTSPGPSMGAFPTIATFAGNPPPDKHGTPATFFGVANHIPAGVNRKGRGTFIVDGVALTGQAALTLT